MNRLRLGTPSACLAVLIGLCGSEGGDSGEAVTRDSAGIVIVENAELAGSADPDWRLSERPRVRIGTVEGDPRQQLYRVRDAAVLEDGRIAVANEGSHEIRLYGEDGRHLRSVGGEGEGPGEFRFLTWLQAIGDSLWAYDRGTERVSVFAADGSLARSITLVGSGNLPSPRPLGVFADRTLLARAFTTAYFEPGEEVRRDLDLYLRLGPTGTVLDTLGRLPGNEHYLRASDDGLADFRVPFARASVVAVAPRAVYFGAAETWEIARYSMDGRLERLIRLARDPRPATSEALDRLLAEYQRQAPTEGARQGLEAWIDRVPAPPTMPAYSELRLDAEGNLWVEDYRPPFEEDAPPRWSVFDSEGRLLGTTTLPRRFTPYEIGSDFVLGRGVDEMDAEYVELYNLRKPNG